MSRVRDLAEGGQVTWQVVSSSNVHSALFDESESVFYVRFLRSGPDDIYVYPNRSPDEWDDFRVAMSKGEWIWNNPIEENWPYELLTTRDFAQLETESLRRPLRNFLE